MNNNSRRHLIELDQLRGIAIIAVLLCHTFNHAFLNSQLPWNGWIRDFNAPAEGWTYVLFGSFGGLGVAMFFVVSGFCIHTSFHSLSGRWASFFTRRFFRIYPPYFAALVFSILLAVLAGMSSSLGFPNKTTWFHWLTHLFLVHNFNAETVQSINGPFWSMAVEAQLYLLYPLLVYLVGRISWPKALLLTGVCEFLIRGSDAVMQCVPITNTLTNQAVWLLSNSPLGYWFSWTLGAAIADAFLKKQPIPFQGIHPLAWFAMALAAYFFRPLYSFQFILFAMMTASLLSRMLKSPTPKLQLPPWTTVQKIGLWSYSIYLIHEPILNTCILVGNTVVPNEYRHGLISFLMVVTCWLPVLLVSFFWHELIELPAMALGKQLSGKLATHDSSRPAASWKFLKTSLLARRQVLLFGSFVLLLAGMLLISAKLTPPSPEVSNNMAWAFATSFDAKSRDGIHAVKLAEDACQRTSFKQTIMVGTLAAAYAEAGRFDDAIATAQNACALAAERGETNLLSRNAELLELYRNHQAYHEPAH